VAVRRRQEDNMVVRSQLFRARELLALSDSQLDELDAMIDAEIIKSEQCMKILREKLAPVIDELKSR
jgi:hypothetical protein